MTSTSQSAQSAGSLVPSRPGGGIREVFHLAYPVVLTQMSATAMGVVDSAMVGRLGATELAAVGFGAIWIWTIFSLVFGTATGIQTFVSQSDGAGEQRECGPWTWQGAYAVVPVTAVLVALLLPMVPTALGVLGPSTELRHAAGDYVSARIWGEVGFALVMVFSSYFRGIGDTRTPLYVTLFANAVNALVDYGLIFGHWGLPAWGVRGAGAATAIGQWLAAAALFVVFRRGSHRRRYGTGWVAPDPGAIRRFLRTAVPMGGQWFIEMTAFAVFTTVVARMGDESMAASQAFVMLLSLSFMQAHGISIAAGTLVGRYVGARNPEAARRSFRTSIQLGLGVGGIVALLFVSIPEALLRIFTDDPAVMTLGRPLLLLGAVFQICDAVVIITEGSLRGAGDTRIPFLLQTCFGWLLFLPLGYGLGVTLGYGLTGAWAGGTVSIAVLAVLLVRRFTSGAWERIRI